MGKEFKGVYNLYDSSLNLFTASQKSTEDNTVPIHNLADALLDEKVGGRDAIQLREDVELLQGVYGPLDTQRYLEGKISPVFFGSAVNNFGVKELLDTFINIAPVPQGRDTDKRFVAPGEEKFTRLYF